ncbi:hypothetical protein TNCV_3148731 [Trichonephila clavipes]|nr:hypothetical protein TNCV_3148731 [Trichonephila clavipes]
MALYRSPLTVTLWPSSFLKKYGPMSQPDHKVHQTNLPSESSDALTDDSSDEEAPANYLREILLDSEDDDQETE